MRKFNSKFLTKSISESGSKPMNKDYFGFVEMDDFACWVIAESYDKDRDIVSSQLVVDTIVDMFTKKPTLSKRRLKTYVKEAHKQLRMQSSKFRLRASVMVVASNYKRIRYVVCGNCKLHVFRGNNIFLKSQDQSLYQEMINEEKVPDDGKRGMEESRNLFDYLGKAGKIKISASKKYVLEDSDVMTMTTWGFWEKVSTVEMLDAIDGAKDPLLYLEDLQDLFLSKQTGTINNYTATVVFVNKTFVEVNNTKKYIKAILMILIPILIIATILGVMYYIKYDKRRDKLNLVSQSEQKGDTYIEDKNYDRALVEFDNAVKDSKTLTETKGKKARENKEIKDRLTVKQKTTQYIIEGDTSFDEGNYAEAQEYYEKALKEAKINLDFYDLIEIEAIEEKIALCEDNVYIEELMDLAEIQGELGDYETATATYNEARSLAVSIGNKVAKKDIRLKMAELNAKKIGDDEKKTEEEKAEEEKVKAEKNAEAATLELDADKALTDGDYATAIDGYNQAMDMYVENGDLEKASATEKKVAEANEKVKQEDKDKQAEIADGYVSIGDDYILENSYDEAIKNYKLAKDIYSQLKMPDKVNEVNEKIKIANDNKKEQQKNQELHEIQGIVDEGDKYLADGDYGNAKESYKKAQTLYQGLNELDKVLEMEDKIEGIEEIQKANAEEAKKAAEEQKAKKEAGIASSQPSEEKEKEKEEDKPTQQQTNLAQIEKAKAHVVAGDSYFAQGRYNDAEKEYNSALLIYNQLNMIEEASGVTEKRAKLEIAKNTAKG